MAIFSSLPTGFNINDNTYTRNLVIVGFNSIEDSEKKKYEYREDNLHLTVHGGTPSTTV
jgi:hypothetical protein